MTRLLFINNLQGIIYPILMWVCSVLTLYWQVTSMSFNIDFMSQDQRCTNCLWNTSLNNLNKLCGILPDLKTKSYFSWYRHVTIVGNCVLYKKNFNSLRNIFNQDKYVHLCFIFSTNVPPALPFFIHSYISFIDACIYSFKLSITFRIHLKLFSVLIGRFWHNDIPICTHCCKGPAECQQSYFKTPYSKNRKPFDFRFIEK